MNWPAYLTRRILSIVPVVVAIVVLAFLLINLAPGDPARVLAGERGNPEYLAYVRHKYGLDHSMGYRLWKYGEAVAQGDFGTSLAYQRPVASLIFDRLPATLLLIGAAQVIAIFGILAGAIAGARRGSLFDRATSISTLVVYSTPVFWTGLMLIILFSVELRWLPASGMTSPLAPTSGYGHYVDVLHHLILPAFTLAIVWYLPEYLRLTRAGVIQTMNEDFVLTARATGLSERAVLFRHVFRNALLPVVTLVGLQVGLAISGAIITESVFGWPGLGRLTYESIGTRDYPVLLGILFFTAISVAFMSIVTDVVYALLDPRVKYA